MRKLRIRLKRVGSLRKPVYNIIVTFGDTRVGSGRIFEKIGFYSPLSPIKFFFLNYTRLSCWLIRGATISYTVQLLIGKMLGIYFVSNENFLIDKKRNTVKIFNKSYKITRW